MTYPYPAVRAFIAAQLVAVKLFLNRPDDREHFRAHRVIWTPTIAILDRRGAGHYQSVGYLPPELFLQTLHIGLARAQLAWARYDDAAGHLAPVAEDQASSLSPEALYWLGVARYLKDRKRAPMMEAWNRLLATYPDSIWAARVPPNQEDEPEE